MKTLKEWRFEIAAKRGIKPESVYMRLKRGKHPEVEVIRENHQRQFVVEKASSLRFHDPAGQVRNGP